MKRSAGAKHVWLEPPSHLWQRPPLPPASCAVIYITAFRIFMFFYAAGWDVATNKSSFSWLRDDLLRVFLSSCPHYSDGDTGSLAPVPGGGLRACPTSFIMPSPIKRAAKLHCSGATPRKLSSLACHLVANCWSKGDKSCSPPLHALIALRERERKRDTNRGGERVEGRGAYFLAWRDIDSIAGSLCVWFLAQDVQSWGEWGLYWQPGFHGSRDLQFHHAGFFFFWWSVFYYSSRIWRSLCF